MSARLASISRSPTPAIGTSARYFASTSRQSIPSAAAPFGAYTVFEKRRPSCVAMVTVAPCR